LEVIEQITYLLFITRLDDLQTLGENKATAPATQWTGSSSQPARRTCAGRGSGSSIATTG